MHYDFENLCPRCGMVPDHETYGHHPLCCFYNGQFTPFEDAHVRGMILALEEHGMEMIVRRKERRT